MFKTFFIGFLGLGLLVLGCLNFGRGGKLTVDTPFNLEVNSLVQQSNLVNIFAIQPKETKVDAEFFFKQYPIKTIFSTTSKQQLKQLKNLIGNSNLYQNDGVFKKCYFTPEYGFQFIYQQKNQSDTVTFLLSKRCQEMKIFCKETIQKEDLTEHLNLLMNWLNEL